VIIAPTANGGVVDHGPTLDRYRTASTLIQQYGPEEAVLMAAKRADALLALGDVEGQRVWKGVLRQVGNAILDD
jgi:hypothetical protein